MSHFTDTLADIRERSVYALASDADVHSPDSPDSDGAALLKGARTAILEAVEYAGPELDAHTFETLRDEMGETMDSVPSVYTYTIWQTWTDLYLYHEEEEISEANYDGRDLTDVASWVAMRVCERLGYAILDELEEAIREDEDEAEDDE